MSTESLPIVHVIGTGGSISCIGKSLIDFTDYGYADRHYTIEQMLARMPEARRFASVRCEQFTNVYGGELSPARWPDLTRRVNTILREAPETAGVVITHGTSPLEETAYFLNLTVKSPKPVVITGAMRPMTAISNDAELNLLDCVRVAASPAALNRGVLVVLNSQIQAARGATKTSTSRVDAFKSADLGFLGYADSDGEVVFYRDTTRLHAYRTEFDVGSIEALPRVDIVAAYAGTDGASVAALVAADCLGLVAAGVGSGGAPRAFLDVLSAADAGCRSSSRARAGSGRVMARRALVEHGFILADNLLPRKARVLPMLALTRTHEAAEIQRI